MEVDAMHSCIERAQKYCSVNVPSDWYLIISGARQDPFRIIPLEFEDILDFKDLMTAFSCKKNTDGFPVKWNQIRWIRVDQSHPYTMMYKNSFEDETFQSVDIRRKKKSTRRSMEEMSVDILEVGRKYTDQLKISKEKKADLIK